MIFELSEDINLIPNPKYAEEDGLLAVGGDLSVKRLLALYSNGIFPWFNEGDPILWWSPDPRYIIMMYDFTVRKSLRKFMKKSNYEVRFNTNFREVVLNCKSSERKDQEGTWITKEIVESYCELNKLGYAISVEVYDNSDLIGGLYGVAIGKMFAGESMFSKKSYASQIALVYLYNYLKERNFHFIDCQIYSKHLEQFGAFPHEREFFLDLLKKALL
ncbi:MAG: leucyl/phenylalanyl-tRNA--protein transferase [Candidatus Cloacimonadota bacterium]|nr:MAG: leucyl/phenylalanyl-tRNA--protein transferase [Candidatus Cloacimonadota bacterium]PIE78028.1 MAG: leucyl/phenylalanyl-tRNA--protein transferase [Candidatus Delongbacteria bacterium]